MEERLKSQIDFIIEADKLKQIYRQNILLDKSRQETDAEHSWHLALMAILLCEHVSPEKIDVLRVIKMVIIHDIVEIDAGDTYCFDAQGTLDQNCREQSAAKRLFGMLPADQAHEMQQLWEEFEEQVTPEARFAGALDRLQPLLLHCNTEGESWKNHGITSQKVIERNKRTKEISENLGSLVDELIHGAIAKGYLAK
ncbi:MAG: HD domain-containing protein [Sporomusaceae bacterium]|nr:HD domain-containing protein [Sporomusaceae bacterium]